MTKCDFLRAMDQQPNLKLGNKKVGIINAGAVNLKLTNQMILFIVAIFQHYHMRIAEIKLWKPTQVEQKVLREEQSCIQICPALI